MKKSFISVIHSGNPVVRTHLGGNGKLNTRLLNYWSFGSNYTDLAPAAFGTTGVVQDNGTPGAGTSIQTGGPFGAASGYAHFNRATQPSYITVPATSDIYMGGKDLSVSVWVRVSSWSVNFECIFAQGDAGSNYRLARSGSGNFMTFTGGNGSAIAGVENSAYPVNDGMWHHFVGISSTNGTGISLYQDGVLIDQRTDVSGLLVNNTTTQKLLIGENPGATNRQFGGDIADMAMWDRALTDAEVSQIYNSGKAGSNLSAVIAATPVVDTDGDGLPDWWEIKYGLNPNDNGTIGESSPGAKNGPGGALGDPDSDGRTNLQEYQNHNGQWASDPTLADTDGDGANDGEEFAAGSNPLVTDTDGDGLTDGQEILTYGTNPLLRDTDADGVNDFVEVNSGSNPLVANTGLNFGLLMNLPLNTGYNSIVNWVAPNLATATPVGSAPLTTGSGGKFGEALNLTNAGYLEINGDENLFDFDNGQSMTASLWFTANAWNNSWATLIAKGNDSNPGNFRISRNNATNNLSANGGTGDTIAVAPVIVPPDGGIWHHAVLVAKPGQGVEFWVDGQIRGTSATSALGNGAFRLWIGNNPGSTGRRWNGKIDDVAVWRRALSAAEIGQIWNNGNGASIESMISVDTDGDGLPDYWETQYGLDPHDNGTSGESSLGAKDGPDGALGDPDGDGLTNLQEFLVTGTNPNLYDTDGDGADDGQEFAAGSNPRVQDTDGDTLSDGAEINTYHTNPLLVDTDGDGINDNIEIAIGTDPTVANTGFDFGLLMNLPLDNNFNSRVNWINPNGVTASPVGYVKLDNNGKFGGCFHGDGMGYLNVNGDENLFDFQGGLDMTVSLWCTADPALFAAGTSSQTLISKGDTPDTWRIVRSSENNWFRATAGNGDLANDASFTPIDINVWHHVVLVAKYRKTAELWVDGRLQGSSTVPNMGNVVTRLFIGKNSGTGADGARTNDWLGKIDDVGIWARALSGAQIAQIYNGGTGRSIDSLLAVDTDHDGLPDYWEKQYGLDPNDSSGDNGGSGDLDSDGLTNLEEFQAGTNPTLADTDADGLTDGEEVHTYGTNPLLADSDGDGISDLLEVQTYHTNPNLSDTDGDGMSDNLELSLAAIDPLNYNPLVAGNGFAFGLMGYFPMDANFDSVATPAGPFPGTPQGTAMLTPAKFGNAASLSATGHVIVGGSEDVWDFLDTNGPGLPATGWNWSTSMWFTLDSPFTSNDRTLIGKGSSTSTKPISWRIDRNGSDPYLRVVAGFLNSKANNSAVNLVQADIPLAAPAVAPNAWHHLALVNRSGDRIEIWYDGVKVRTLAAAQGMGNSPNNLWIGNNPQSTNRQWPGKIDDVAMWSRSLSDTEIAQIWNDGSGKRIGDFLNPPPELKFIGGEAPIYDSVTGIVSLKWASKEFHSYQVLWGTDVANITNVLNPSVAAGGATTTFGFPNPLPGAPRMFFVVKQN